MNLRFLFFVITALALVVMGFFAWRFFETAERIHIENNAAKSGFENISSILPGKQREKLEGEDAGRINILLLGRAGERYPGKNLTDTVMIASIDTVARKAGFLSLPRDLFVPISGTDFSTKLNSLYQYGLSQGDEADTMVSSVEHITGIDIPYFVILDFDGFEKVIDDLGGIRIFSERDILDTRYPGKNYSYETFELPAGWHYLDGKTALKYARERHSDPEGDFGRAKRQQQIIKAAQEKAFSARTYLNVVMLDRLLTTLGESVRTNLSIAEIASLAELGKTIDLHNASTAVVDAWKKESLLRVDHIQVGPARAFILVPRTGNWNEIRNLTENIFDQEAIRKRRELIAAEQPRILLVSNPEHATETGILSRTLTASFPGSEIRTDTSATLAKTGESGIMDTTALRKPYSMDELLDIFDAGKITEVPTDIRGTIRPKNTPDFVVLLGERFFDRKLSEATLGDSDDDMTAMEDGFSDFLEPQEAE
ncbi:MAG: LCP family protein [Candidatus Moranbacteria bacterium]|nr:LCP family protein [Candidatus Moranbacteria bacterium]